MNIMLFSRILAKTGVGNHVNQLSNALQQLGHTVVVVSGTKDIIFDNQEIPFFLVDTLSRNPFRVIKTVFALRKIIKKNQIDIVHCHHRVAAIYMRLCQLVCRVPFVYTLHLANIPCDFFHRKLTFVGERAIGVSTEVSEFLVKGLKVPVRKVVTVLNGVDETKLSPLSAEEKSEVRVRWAIPRDRILFVMHSRIAEVKNHLLVVKAVAQLSPEERERICVVCSGEKAGAYYEELLSEIDRYGIADSFRFVGWCNTRDILGIADFLLLPSYNEGFALNACEAFFMKVPVARTRTAGFRDQKYCLPIRDNYAEDVAEIMKRAISVGLSEYSELAEKAYGYACESFSSKRMAENTVKVYNEVLSRG